MRRRKDDSGSVDGPPEELLSYSLWCERRGRLAFGTAEDAASLTEAGASFRDWQRDRERWKAAHGGEPLDWIDGHRGAPFDPSAI